MSSYVLSQHESFTIRDFVLSLFKSTHQRPIIIKVSPAEQKNLHYSWKTFVSFLGLFASFLVFFLLRLLHSPLQLLGQKLEFLLNTVSANGGFFQLANRLITGRSLKNPTDDPSNYYSIIGFLDWRTQLDEHLAVEHSGKRDFIYRRIKRTFFPETKRGPLLMAELCVMSSKLAYENAYVIERVVRTEWKMNFVGRYECWNNAQRRNSTPVFLYTDREVDANIVVVVFKGTSPFDTNDWSTDFDFSWYELPKLGAVHVGFLEALGLGDRNDLQTLAELGAKLVDGRVDPQSGQSLSGLSADVIADTEKQIAFDVVTQKVGEVLSSNRNAKLYITGHSLGGALACLLAALLYCEKPNQRITRRLDGVYTFGQPRVGSEEFARFMSEKLCSPINRYFRIVHGYDIVPRVPFDGPISKFKHSGLCFFFDSYIRGKVIYEEPNKNYFSPLYVIPMEMDAIWELIYNTFFIAMIHGKTYKESLISTLFRAVGMLLPGVAAHSPVNYVNAIRLGIEASFHAQDHPASKLGECLHSWWEERNEITGIVSSH